MTDEELLQKLKEDGMLGLDLSPGNSTAAAAFARIAGLLEENKLLKKELRKVWKEK